jgi:hypothetical protein
MPASVTVLPVPEFLSAKVAPVLPTLTVSPLITPLRLPALVMVAAVVWS